MAEPAAGREPRGAPGPQGVQLEVTRPPLTAHPVFLSLTRHSGGKGDRRGEGRFWVEGRSEVSTTTEPG